jgi:serine/threonine protein kinase
LTRDFVCICFSDIKFYKQRELPPHPNVVRLFGVSLDGPQPVIVLEYCSGGTIDSNQIKSSNPHRSSFL